MNRLIFICVFFIIGNNILICSPLNEEKKPENLFKQNLMLSLGYVSITGNTDTSSGNIEFEHGISYKKILLVTKGKFIFTDIKSNEGVITRKTEKYSAAMKFNYIVKNKKSFFANLSWERDIPSGISKSLSLASGLDFTVEFSKEHKLKTGIGVEAFNESKIENQLVNSKTSFAGYMQVLYNVKLSESNYLKIENQSRLNFKDNQDYRFSNNISYLSHINKILALKIIYNHDYKNLPVQGKKKNNTTTTVNLVFKF